MCAKDEEEKENLRKTNEKKREGRLDNLFPNYPERENDEEVELKGKRLCCIK